MVNVTLWPEVGVIELMEGESYEKLRELLLPAGVVTLTETEFRPEGKVQVI